MIAPATPTERLLLAAFRKPPRDQIQMLREAKVAARNPRPDKRYSSGPTNPGHVRGFLPIQTDHG